MPKKPKDIKRLVIPKLREASRWWSPKKEARELAKQQVEIGHFKNGNVKYKTLYKCSKCKELFEKTETQMDHINPVIDPKVGFVDWNTYIHRLFAPLEGWQLLCTGCHTKKTEKERKSRKKS